MRKFRVLVTGLLIGMAGCQPSAEKVVVEENELTASAALESLIRQYVDVERAKDEPGELRDVSVEAFLQEIDMQRQLLEKIRATATDDLSQEQLIDRRLLIGRLQTSVRTAENRRSWENDPSLYVPSRSIGTVLQPQAPGTPKERAEKVTAMLDKLPERIDHARRNLDRPPQRVTEAAIFQTRGTIASVRDLVPALSEQAGAAGEVLITSSDAALQSLESYLQFLEEELLPRSDGEWAIGKVEYDYILRHRWFLDADADAILERGLQAFEETEALAQETAERIEPGKHWAEVYERLKDDHPAAGDIKQAYQEQMDAAQAFVRDKQIVTLPEGEHVITVDTPPAMRRDSPFGTFQSVDQFDDGLQGRLVLTPIDASMTPEQSAERLRSHHRAWLPVIAVHEAYPGHHAHALKTRENPRMLRRVVDEPIHSEGWGLFTEELMFELGFLQGDDVRLTQLRNRLWRAARVILDVSLHTGSMSVEEAVDFLVEKVRFERFAAELEVDTYTREPTYVLGYLIGMQEITAIRTEYIERFGEPSPPSEFYDRLLRVGSIPPALIRMDLFGATPRAQTD